MESWRIVWRNGFVPLLNRDGLLALRQALVSDSHELLQNYTVGPLPTLTHQHSDGTTTLACNDPAVECGCAVAYAGWKGGMIPAAGADGVLRLGDVHRWFARATEAADKLLAWDLGSRFFLNWWDQEKRDDVVPALLAEVELALAGTSELVAQATIVMALGRLERLESNS